MVLILLYTGIRAEEFLILENKNIHLDDQYVITGVKTDAGKSRIIPIHNDILPIIQNITIPKSITSGTLTEVNEFTRLYAGVLTVS